MKKILAEKPCLYLENISHKPAEGEEKRKRAHAECLCDRDEDCPKTRNKGDLTMHCFRIMRHERKRKPRGKR